MAGAPRGSSDAAGEGRRPPQADPGRHGVGKRQATAAWPIGRPWAPAVAAASAALLAVVVGGPRGERVGAQADQDERPGEHEADDVKGPDEDEHLGVRRHVREGIAPGRSGGATSLPSSPPMAAADTTSLAVATREETGSRAIRRLRRTGQVPGVLYGGDGDTVTFSVDARVLRHALASSGAIIELSIDGAGGQPVLLKDDQRHPVSGAVMHVDLLRIRLDQTIQTTVPLELIGAEDTPGITEGGVLEHVTREVTIEALPSAIPDVITLDVSQMEINDSLNLAAVVAPAGVEILGELDEVTVATVTPPRLVLESEELEEETEVVGEGEEGAEGEAAPAEDGEEPAAADDGE